MKLSITPVALAVTMALGAAVAQAQTPTYGTTSPFDGGSNDGLYLAVWDNTSGATDLVSLSSIDSQITIASGTLTTPTVGSNGWTQVSNFDGYASVDQINLGTISNFTSFFPAGSETAATQYVVVAANNTGTNVSASIQAGQTPAVSETAVKILQGSISGESASWYNSSDTSPLGDKTNTQSWSVPSGSGLGDGNLGLTGTSFASVVGTAANFYDYVVSNGRPATLTTTEYAGSDGTAGFWFLSSTGDLSWNLVASTVPLPPAVWLFASGLIGLGLIGRRRGLGAAV